MNHFKKQQVIPCELIRLPQEAPPSDPKKASYNNPHCWCYWPSNLCLTIVVRKWITAPFWSLIPEANEIPSHNFLSIGFCHIQENSCVKN